MNENKNLLPIILVVVLVLGLGFLVFKGQAPKAQESTPNQPAMQVDSQEKKMEESLSPYVLKDGNYTFDAALSQITWQAKKSVITSWVDNGTVSLKEGQVVVEGGVVKSGKAVVDMSTITAIQTGKGDGQDMLSKHLKSPDFFDAEKFPTSEFTLSKVESMGSGKYKVDGDLTIKGVTKPYSTELMAQSATEGKVILTGNFSVDRTLFDVKFGSSKFFGDLGDKVIDDNFEVSLRLVGSM